MKERVRILAAPLLPLVALAAPASAETPEQWIALLTRVHGGFGSFLPVGIRIGEDSLGRVVRRGCAPHDVQNSQCVRFRRLNLGDSYPTERLAALQAFALLTDSDNSRA